MTATERSYDFIRSTPGIRSRATCGWVGYVPVVAATFFRGGTIWTGVNGTTTDALLVVDGTVRAFGEAAHGQADGADEVDLNGGFLMPSFGDGHAHPLPGGLEAVGPQVRRCTSVDEIVAE